MDVLDMLAAEAKRLAGEREDFMAAKRAKAAAEDEVLARVVEAVRPALPAICSGSRFDLGRGIYLDERGRFWDGAEVEVIHPSEVLDELALPAIVATLLTAIRSQAGTLEKRTEQVRKEAKILEGIALAFQVGKVR